jgi:ComF family protein
MSIVNELLSSLVHLFYPHSCDGCGRDLARREDILCLRCQRRLPATGFHLYTGNPVERIFWGRVNISHAMAGYYYAPASVLQRLIHRFKYHQRKDIALHLGRQLGGMLRQSAWLYEISCIVPVPLYAVKERRRGYNQAALLAEGIADVTQKPLAAHAMRRNSPTGSQTSRGRASRWENVAQAFSVQHSEALRGQHVLLVDDVITTGATAEACSRALLGVSAGVSICSLAFTATV